MKADYLKKFSDYDIEMSKHSFLKLLGVYVLLGAYN